MVSLWPWRHRDDSSTASFEKTLSALSSKITDIQARLDSLRSRSRRVRVLWTLYLSFAYLVYAIVIILVVGSRNMGAYEWTTVAGGPVLIYTTRSTVAAYYNYRIDSLSSQLKEQQTERAKTIKKLKEATKYDSTHELLEKYGGAEGKPSRPRKDSVDDQDEEEDDVHDRRPHYGMDGQFSAGAPRRTNLPPPPTANIQRQPYSPAPGPPQPGPDALSSHSPMSPHPQSAISSTSIPVTEEFAPNAFAHTPPPPPQAHARYDAAAESHWYDRVMDLLLGEDETAAKNRIVLICQTCRLVNGQAPPGTNSLSELGLWRCMSCGSKNGEMDEGEKITQEVLGARRKNESQQSEREPPPSNTEGEFEKEEGGYQDEVEPGVVGGRSECEWDGKGTGGARKRKGRK